MIPLADPISDLLLTAAITTSATAILLMIRALRPVSVSEAGSVMSKRAADLRAAKRDMTARLKAEVGRR